MSEDTAQQTAPQLQLGDLVTMLESLQLASSRGAFRPEEFTVIGGSYERIFTFLEAAGAVTRPAPPAEQTKEKSND